MTYESFSGRHTATDFLLTEGGSYGHMLHPYDNMSLSFYDLEEIISGMLDAKFKEVREKIDGIAISFSYVNGKIVFARNKTDLSNYGRNALGIDDIEKKFFSKPNVSESFTEAAKDIMILMVSIDPKILHSIFLNGKRFVHVEIVYPGTSNVIEYDSPMLIFHGVSEYDERGNSINDDKRAFDTLSKACSRRQTPKFEIYFGKRIKLVKTDSSIKKSFIDDLDAIRKISGKENGKEINLGTWYRKVWNNYLSESFKRHNLDEDTIERILERIVHKDKKAITVSELRSMDLEWVLELESTERDRINRQFSSYFELLFAKLGITCIKNYTDSSKEKEKYQDRVNSISKRIDSFLRSLRYDTNVPGTLSTDIEIFKQLGELEAILPIEGLVFEYKGKTYKITGSFRYVNHILGRDKYKKI